MLAGLTFFRINRDIVGSKNPKHALRENIVRQSIKTFGRRMSFQKDSFLGVESVSIQKGGKLHYFQQHKLMIDLLALEKKYYFPFFSPLTQQMKVNSRLLYAILFLE